MKFGLGIARRIRSTALARGDKWHLDEVVVAINGKKYWLWRAVDHYSAVLDMLVQSPRDRHAARRLMRKLLRKRGRAPRVLITDKLKSYAAANRDLGLNGEHRQHKGLNNRAENSHQPTRVREKGCAVSNQRVTCNVSLLSTIRWPISSCVAATTPTQSKSGRYAPRPSRRGKA